MWKRDFDNNKSYFDSEKKHAWIELRETFPRRQIARSESGSNVERKSRLYQINKKGTATRTWLLLTWGAAVPKPPALLPAANYPKMPLFFSEENTFFRNLIRLYGMQQYS